MNPQPERADWIGSSDAGVIANVDPYKSRLQLYYEKTGELPANDPDVFNEPMHWGSVLEDPVAAEFARRMDVQVRRVNERKVHKDLRWMRAQIDRYITGTDILLEVKTVGYHAAKDWGKSGTDQVPPYVICQVQHALACTGRKMSTVAALIAGQELRIYDIHRDDGMIDSIITLNTGFWDHLQDRVQPELTERLSSKEIDALKRLHPGTNGERIVLGKDAQHWHETFRACVDHVKQYQQGAEAAKAHLLRMMGDASEAVVPGVDDYHYRRKLVHKAAEKQIRGPVEYMDFRMVKDKH